MRDILSYLVWFYVGCVLVALPHSVVAYRRLAEVRIWWFPCHIFLVFYPLINMGWAIYGIVDLIDHLNISCNPVLYRRRKDRL